MDSRTFMKRLDRIDSLPTLPAIAMEVNNMLQDYNTSIKDLTKTIEKDQAVVPKILKLVNSAFFGLESKISNISRAIILLGYNTVRNAVISVSIIDMLSGEKGLEGFDITDFWRHSISVAVTSKYLAEKTRLHSTEDAFTAGLLHDIGKVVLVQHFQEHFRKVWTSSKENGLSFYEAEKREGPVTHARIGGYLAKKWQMPEGMVDAIRRHHGLTKTANDLDLLMIVHVADMIVNCFVTDQKDSLDFSAIYPDAAKTMETSLNTVSDWFPQVSEEIESACNFFLDKEV